MKTYFLAASLGLLMPGCSALGPFAPAPIAQAERAPAMWRLPADAPATAPRAAGPWWDTLPATELAFLIQQALDTSPTVASMQAKVQLARASRGQVLAGGWPSVTSSTQATRSQSGAAGVLASQGATRLDATWELDLFGAVQRGQEGADARLAATEQQLAAARVSLSAEVATAYLAHQVCKSAQALNLQDLASRKATLSTTRVSVEVGSTAPYLLTRTMASVEDAQAQRATLATQCEQAEHLLSRLTGIGLANLQAQLEAASPEQLLGTTLDLWKVGLPAEVLAARPDVQAAHRLVAAAAADVGLAMADQLPRLSLTGGLAYTTQDSGAQVSFGSWSFGPVLSIPVFDAGRKAAATEGARARLVDAQAGYDAAIAAAVQEVNDGLSRYRASLERKAAAASSAAQYQRYFQTVELRHKEGASTLLELEDARRTWLTARSSELAANQEHIQAWIYLNKVTAGSVNS